MKLKIGVLCGGRSIEHEVSFNSGRTICNHLDTEKFIPIPLYQTTGGRLYILPERFLCRGKTSDFEHRLAEEAQEIRWDDLTQYVDALYIAMHGRYGEDGALQGFLEILGIPYFGSKMLASALGMDKALQKKLLAHHNILTPRGILISREEIEQLEQSPLEKQYQVLTEKLDAATLAYPCVVKPSHEGSSLGVSIAHDQIALCTALFKAAYIHPEITQSVVVEEQIFGMEFSCIIITDQHGSYMPLAPTEIAPETHIFDYEQKYMPGRAYKYTPARCTREQQQHIQRECIAVMDALGMTGYARIDGFLMADNRIVIIDPNTFFGMAPASFTFLQAAEAGMGHTDFINYLFETELIRAGLLPSYQERKLSQMDTTTTVRIKVAVLMGGSSAEREISLESGRNVSYKLSPEKYEVIPVFVDENLKLHRLNQKLLVKNSTREINDNLPADSHVPWNSLAETVDFVFIALHGGAGENGQIQGTLEFLGIPYNGSSIATSALCMDKYATASFLRNEGFDLPSQLLLDVTDWQNINDYETLLHTHGLQFPLVVKPHDDGCSVMVAKAQTVEELAHSLKAIFDAGRSHGLIENYITGMELTVGVLGNDTIRVLPPSHAVSSRAILSIEEKFLPGAGENQTPAPLPPASIEFVQKVIGDVYRAIHCRGYARIDCFYQSAEVSPTGIERLIILEINTLPALTPATCLFHQAAELGMKPMEFINQVVILGLEEHSSKKHVFDQVRICSVSHKELQKLYLI